MRLATKTQVCGGAEGMCAQPVPEVSGAGLVTKDVGEREGCGKSVSKFEEREMKFNDMLEVRDDGSYDSVSLTSVVLISSHLLFATLVHVFPLRAINLC